MSAATRRAKEAGGSAFSAFAPGVRGARRRRLQGRVPKARDTHSASTRPVSQGSLLGTSAPSSSQQIASSWGTPAQPPQTAGSPGGLSWLLQTSSFPSCAAPLPHLPSAPALSPLPFPNTPVSSSAPCGEGFVLGSSPPLSRAAKSAKAGKASARLQLQVRLAAASVAASHRGLESAHGRGGSGAGTPRPRLLRWHLLSGCHPAHAPLSASLAQSGKVSTGKSTYRGVRQRPWGKVRTSGGHSALLDSDSSPAQTSWGAPLDSLPASARLYTCVVRGRDPRPDSWGARVAGHLR
jgi:hypothetical protein